jgi:hypothetical protein
MRIATLNMQNLRLMPDGALFGARDRDETADPSLDRMDRRLTAELLAQTGADVLALQEVFDQQSLDIFHDRWLSRLAAPYPYRLCLPGNDGRGQDVAIMARHPWDAARSYAATTPADIGLVPPAGIDPDLPLFRRDCLEVRFGALTLFVVHFKAPYPDAQKAWSVRRMEALATVHLLAGAGPFWLVAGDLNDPPQPTRAVAPLEARGENLMTRLPPDERWTYFEPDGGHYGTPDAFVASPELAAYNPDAMPQILRMGMGRESKRYRGPRLADTGQHRPHASDHSAVVIDLVIP